MDAVNQTILIRITSYNVCYTKLLREALKMAYLASGQVPDIQCLNDPTKNEPNIYFTDINSNQWYCPYIKDAYRKGYLNTWPGSTTFSPSVSMKRIDVARLISSVFGVYITDPKAHLNACSYNFV